MKSLTKTFKTKLDKSGDASSTAAEFTFDGVTEDQIAALAMRSLVIMRQADYRTAGQVPATDTVEVAQLLKRQPGGFQVTPESVAKRFSVDANKYTEVLQALGVADLEIKKLVAKKFDHK